MQSDRLLRQGSAFDFEGETHTLYQVRVDGELKATAHGVNKPPRVWASREDFERETGYPILPGRAAEIPAYEPKPWDDARLRYAVNYGEADIYAGVGDDLKREALTKLNEIEPLIVEAPSRRARDEYDKHKSHITGSMARYAACLHNHAAGRKNFTEERAEDALADLRTYLALPPGHDGIHAAFHVDPEMTDEAMRELARSFPPADEIAAAPRRRLTEHEYIGGKRLLPPKKLAQAVVFYTAALDHQRKALSRESDEYERLRREGPDAVSDEEAEKWGGRRDICLDAALRSKQSSIAGAKGDVVRLSAKIEEIREAMKGRTARGKERDEDEAQASLFC
jgi:hypothetical protein